MYSQIFMLSIIASVAGAAEAFPTDLTTDVCVVGGGSGGIGAAVAAARGGADVILIEKQNRLGGTSTLGYVCNWEPGPGDELAKEIFDRLSKVPNAVAVTTLRNAYSAKAPYGLHMPDPAAAYEQSLKRAGLPGARRHSVVFEPEAFHNVVSAMLKETGRCRVMLQTEFVKAEADGPRVAGITAKSAGGELYRIRARTFIDSTGNAALCRALGCKTMLGADAKSVFGERSAPDQPAETLNAISLCYRIRRSANPVRQAAPDPPASGWVKSAFVVGLPGGDFIVNPLALLPGDWFVGKGYDAAMAEARRRVQAHWNWLQGFPAFAEYEFESFAPMLGIRESWRVAGECVLTQQDLDDGLAKQTHPDIIAIADHAFDVHGEGSRAVHGELAGPYGIPFRCLVPKGMENLLVASRCASFSHIAASSCRLSRTVLALGRAAGTAAAMAKESGQPVAGVDGAKLRARLLGPQAREKEGKP